MYIGDSNNNVVDPFQLSLVASNPVAFSPCGSVVVYDNKSWELNVKKSKLISLKLIH